MLIKFLSLFFLFYIFFALPADALADENFDISSNATYTVSQNGKTNVKQVISIKNNTEFTYTPKYLITSAFSDIENLTVYNINGAIPNVLKENSNSQKSIEITFKERVVGLGRVNEFSVEFDTNEAAIKKGSVWEVSIPGITNARDYVNYTVTLIVPEAFGPPNIVKPQINVSRSPYRFDKEQIANAGIYMLFGDKQFYTLNLSYHINNPQVIPVKTEIALPPNTSYQEVRINKLDPKPLDVYRDADGNWLAIYALSPRQTLTINADVAVQVFSRPIFEFGKSSESLLAQKYWEINDPEIQRLAKELKTPQAIYNYVVENLTYNYEKVADKNVRLGAKEAILKKDFAVCLEFTDLFVALARAAGIRARSVEGYAYTTNSKLRPLSLANDVLHSWPEYFDENTKTWIMVDPTWSNTTRGVDYFNSFDFDHIAFVIKGQSSTYPIPAGGYKANGNTKDVKVQISTPSSFFDNINSEIELILPENALSALPVTGEVIISNTGNLALPPKKLTVDSGLSHERLEYNIESIPPFGKKKVALDLGKTSFLTNGSYEVTISFDGESTTKSVKVMLFPDYFLLIAGGVIFIVSITVAWASYKTWGIYISRHKK